MFALAATLLWVETSAANNAGGVAMRDGDVAQDVVSIRSADFVSLDRL